MGYAWLNLGSLVLGCIAWGLPIVGLLLRNKVCMQHGILAAVSIGSCSLALFMQILYQNHLVKIEDWSALMDTSSAVALLCAVLLAVTILFNAVTLVIAIKNKRSKG